MNLFNRNNRKSKGGVQQHTALPKASAVPVVCRYPHRMDESGNIPTKVVFVQTTCEPDFRYANFFAWIMHIHLLSGSGFITFLFKGGRP